MKKLMQKARKGATFIEYAMLAGLVAVVVAVAALFFGDQIKSLFSDTGKKVQQVDKGLENVDLTPDASIDGGSQNGSKTTPQS
jgi:Flp pilus assembly pilin Flp